VVAALIAARETPLERGFAATSSCRRSLTKTRERMLLQEAFCAPSMPTPLSLT